MATLHRLPCGPRRWWKIPVAGNLYGPSSTAERLRLDQRFLLPLLELGLPWLTLWWWGRVALGSTVVRFVFGWKLFGFHVIGACLSCNARTACLLSRSWYLNPVRSQPELVGELIAQYCTACTYLSIILFPHFNTRNAFNYHTTSINRSGLADPTWFLAQL